MATNTNQKLAVLIDADNAQASVLTRATAAQGCWWGQGLERRPQLSQNAN